MTRLWLLRHAAVEAAPGLCYGATDLAARPDDTREAAAAFARDWLAAREASSKAMPSRSNDHGHGHGHGAVEFNCSPLRRCTALAEAIAERLPALGPVRVDARLAEMDFGAWESRPWDAIGREPFDAWLADFADARAGGHGESTRVFMARVGAAWDAWRDYGRDTVWVTHAGVMRAAMLLEQGVRCPDRADRWPARPIDHGAWMMFERAG